MNLRNSKKYKLISLTFRSCSSKIEIQASCNSYIPYFSNKNLVKQVGRSMAVRQPIKNLKPKLELSKDECKMQRKF